MWGGVAGVGFFLSVSGVLRVWRIGGAVVFGGG